MESGGAKGNLSLVIGIATNVETTSTPKISSAGNVERRDKRGFATKKCVHCHVGLLAVKRALKG